MSQRRAVVEKGASEVDFAAAAASMVLVPDEPEEEQPLQLRGRTAQFILRAQGGLAVMEEEVEGQGDTESESEGEPSDDGDEQRASCGVSPSRSRAQPKPPSHPASGGRSRQHPRVTASRT